jgi:hypothetical protein
MINDTNIPFTEQEMAVLHKGLKYNLHTTQKLVGKFGPRSRNSNITIAYI